MNKPTCKFYMQGHCNKGQKCEFNHDKNLCKDEYFQGKCIRRSCPYKHVNNKRRKKRLKKRNTESEKSLNIRIRKSKREMNYITKFDKVIVNDNLDIATNELINLVTNFLSK